MYVVLDAGGYPDSFHDDVWKAAEVISKVEKTRPDISIMYDIKSVTGFALLYWKLFKFILTVRNRV